MIRYLALFVVAAACFLPTNLRAAEPQLAHIVFFELAEDSAEARQKLVAACDKYLSEHEGTVYYSAGVIAEDLKREVNDRNFDVALHLVFRTKADHDRYQTNPRHLKFIEENKASWKGVRVFDSYIAAPADDTQAQRIPLPDPAAFFAGMIRGKVTGKRDGQLIVTVAAVPRQWKRSRAKDAEALIDRRVLVGPGANDRARRLIDLVEVGETVTLDVAHRKGEVLDILELTQEQRERVK